MQVKAYQTAPASLLSRLQSMPPPLPGKLNPMTLPDMQSIWSCQDGGGGDEFKWIQDIADGVLEIGVSSVESCVLSCGGVLTFLTGTIPEATLFWGFMATMTDLMCKKYYGKNR